MESLEPDVSNQVDDQSSPSVLNGGLQYLIEVMSEDNFEETSQAEQAAGTSGENEESGNRRTSSDTLTQASELSALQSVLSLFAEGNILSGSSNSRSAQQADTSSDTSDSSLDLERFFWQNSKRSKLGQQKPRPTDEQLQKLHDNDFTQITQTVLGPNLGQRCLPQLLAQRELGCSHRSWRNFSHGLQCQLVERFLPNDRQVMTKHREKVFCGSYSDDGDLFLSACQDQHLRVYDVSKGRFAQVKNIRARNVGWSVLDAVLSPDKRHLIYSSWCADIHQVDIVNGGYEGSAHVALSLEPPDETRFCIFSLRFSHDGDEILCGANDGFLYLYDRFTMRQSIKLHAHDEDVNTVAFVDIPTHVVASGGDDGLCKIWDRRALHESNPVPVGVFAGHLDGITYIDPRGDGRYILSNSKDQSIKLWDLRKFSSENAVEETRRAVRSQNWDYRWQNVPRNLCRLPAEIKDDVSVMSYRGNHSILQTLIRCHFSPAFSTGQKFIYTGCATGAVIIYDALTGQLVSELAGHRSVVRDVTWHPYLPEIISSSWDYTVARWNYSEDISREKCGRKKSKSSSKDRKKTSNT